MTWTITLRASWLAFYLAIGVVMWLPLESLAYRRPQCCDRIGFWRGLRRAWRCSGPLRAVVPIVAWPLGLWETRPARRRR